MPDPFFALAAAEGSGCEEIDKSQQSSAKVTKAKVKKIQLGDSKKHVRKILGRLYFDERENMDPRYRIIYRLIPDEENPAKAEVIRIGLKVPHRDEEYIYRQVGRALKRLPDR